MRRHLQRIVAVGLVQALLRWVMPMLPGATWLTSALYQHQHVASQYMESILTMLVAWGLEQRLNRGYELMVADVGKHLCLPRLDKVAVDGHTAIQNLNEPWTLFDLSKLHLGFDSRSKKRRQVPADLTELDDMLNQLSFLKVLVMGRYKVGKSQLLNWLNMAQAMPGTLVNTRGEIYLTDPRHWPETVFLDTEGFEQPINSTEPEFRKQLILEHAKKSVDVIIMVIPQLLASDLMLTHRIIGMLRVSGVRLLVVHNLMNFNTVNELRKYRDVFQSHYVHDAGRRPLVKGELLETRHAGTANNDATVWHFFFGNDLLSETRKHNRKQVEDLCIYIRHAPKRNQPLFSSLKMAITTVSNNAYELADLPTQPLQAPEKKDDIPDAPLSDVEASSMSVDGSSASSSSGTFGADMRGGQIHEQLLIQEQRDRSGNTQFVIANKTVQNQRQKEVGGQVVLAPHLEPQWMDPVYERDAQHPARWHEWRPLRFGLNKIDRRANQMSVVMENDAALQVTFTRVECSWDGKHVNKQTVVETIVSDHAMSVNKTKQMLLSRRLIELSNEVVYLVPINKFVDKDPSGRFTVIDANVELTAPVAASSASAAQGPASPDIVHERALSESIAHCRTPAPALTSPAAALEEQGALLRRRNVGDSLATLPQ